MHFKFIILLVFTIYSNLVFSQKGDSLINLLNHEQNDSIKSDLNQLLGDIFLKASVYDSAYLFYNNANILAKKNNNLYEISETFVQKGNVKYCVGENKEADSLYDKAFFISKQLNDSNLNVKVYNSIGINCLRINDTIKAIKSFRLALGICPKSNLFFKGNIYANLGQIKRSETQLDSALFYFQLSEDIWRKMGRDDLIARIQFEIGKIYFIQKKFNKSIASIRLSLNVDSAKQNKIIRLWKYKRLSDAFVAINKYDSAYYYFNLHYKMYIAVFEGVNVNVKKIELDTEAKNKEEENIFLSNKNKLQREVIRNRNLLVVIGFIVILAILLISILLLFNRKKLYRTNNLLLSKNNEIQKQKEELEMLNQQMFASNLKIDQQNIDVLRQNNEIKLQKDEVVKKTVDLLVLNRELRMNLKLRDGLTNMIVHDLKNPISNIINLAENKEVSFFAKEILTLVENILDIQKYEGFIMPLKKTSISLKKIVIDAIKQISLFAERKNIKIQNKINNSVIVFADEEILRRVIVNLLSNSIKYSYANGKIVLDCIKQNDENVILKVTDFGIGINKDKIHLIFNKFSQIMAKKTGAARSTGLGLTFCKMAIKAHGGKIIVESEPDKFTSFSFNIEISKIKPENTLEITELSKTKDIIISEDDKMYLKPFYKKLNKCEVYEIGILRNILKDIDENYSLNVDNWKKELNKAIYNCNFDLYKELVNKIN